MNDIEILNVQKMENENFICNYCVFFEPSDICYEDNEEPNDLGFCQHDKILDKVVNEKDSCEMFKPY